MTEIQEEQSEPTRALKSPIMTADQKMGQKKLPIVVCCRRHQRDQQIQKWNGRIYGSINKQIDM